MRGGAIHYSASELAWVEAHRELTRQQLHIEFVAKFERSDVTKNNLTALCKRRGWYTGRNGRFVPGQVSLTKGMKMPFNENSARTQFKKGQTPHHRKQVGHTRRSKDGYVEVLVDPVNPHTGAAQRVRAQTPVGMGQSSRANCC